MEFGFDFDDELFGEGKTKSDAKTRSFKAKNCDSEWFVVQTNSNQDAFEDQNQRFYADMCYHRGDVEEALKIYTAERENRKFNCSSTVERELADSIVRSLIKLTRYQEAEDHLKKILQDQEDDASFWYSLAKVYSHTGNVQDEIKALQKCLLLHSSNYHFWLDLAKAYMKAHHTDISSKFPCMHQSGNTCNSTNSVMESGKSVCHSNLGSCKDCPGITSTKQVERSQCVSARTTQEWGHKAHCPCTNRCNCFRDCAKAEIATRTHDDNKSEECDNVSSSTDRKLTHLGIDVEVVSLQQNTATSLSIHDNLSADGKISNMQDTGMSCDCSTKFSDYNLAGYVCLLRTRFLVKRSIWSSESFVKEKAKSLLDEVERILTSYELCHCGGLRSALVEQHNSDEIDTSDHQFSSNIDYGERAQEFTMKWFGRAQKIAHRHVCPQ